jgi:hypothetical protein
VLAKTVGDLQQQGMDLVQPCSFLRLNVLRFGCSCAIPPVF